ncbi:MAG: DNA polymerase III subunit delta [Xanthobacteraceae bacterium]|nr:DNA polymerase III subunit delta [Xanthobacteraceae bacterium]
MVAVKNADVDRFVARPDPASPVILVYGPDTGLVRERVGALVAGAVDDPRDPFALARIEGDLLADEPERLVEEAHTVPLFGGRRAVWVKAGGRNFTPAVERVLAAPPAPDCRIVIEAGDLKRNAPLRAACERAQNAAALPCYADSTRDLTRLIDEEMREASLTIAPDARRALAHLIGGDRSTSRSELRKLALYARGKTSVVLDDVLAIVTDATDLTVDAIVDAAFAGNAQDLEAGIAKAQTRGITVGALISAVIRHAATLHRLRLSVEQGRSAANVVEAAGPAIHFSRKAAVQAALTAWSAERLERLIGRLGDTALDTRQRANLAYPIMHRMLIDIARLARRRD